MKDHIGVLCLLQGTLKGLHQMMGKLPYKADSVGQEDFRSVI